MVALLREGLSGGGGASMAAAAEAAAMADQSACMREREGARAGKRSDRKARCVCGSMCLCPHLPPHTHASGVLDGYVDLLAEEFPAF